MFELADAWSNTAYFPLLQVQDRIKSISLYTHIRVHTKRNETRTQQWRVLYNWIINQLSTARSKHYFLPGASFLENSPRKRSLINHVRISASAIFSSIGKVNYARDHRSVNYFISESRQSPAIYCNYKIAIVRYAIRVRNNHICITDARKRLPLLKQSFLTCESYIFYTIVHIFEYKNVFETLCSNKNRNKNWSNYRHCIISNSEHATVNKSYISIAFSTNYGWKCCTTHRVFATAKVYNSFIIFCSYYTRQGWSWIMKYEFEKKWQKYETF